MRRLPIRHHRVTDVTRPLPVADILARLDRRAVPVVGSNGGRTAIVGGLLLAAAPLSYVVPWLLDILA